MSKQDFQDIQLLLVTHHQALGIQRLDVLQSLSIAIPWMKVLGFAWKSSHEMSSCRRGIICGVRLSRQLS
jgi:hypothetical protein